MSLLFQTSPLCYDGQGFHPIQLRAAFRVDLGLRGPHPKDHGPHTYPAAAILFLGRIRSLNVWGGGLGSRAALSPAEPGAPPQHILPQPLAAGVSSGLSSSLSRRQAWRRRNRRLSLWLCWPDQGSPLTHRHSHAHVPTLGTQGHTLNICVSTMCLHTHSELPPELPLPVVNYKAKIHRWSTHRAHALLSPVS